MIILVCLRSNSGSSLASFLIMKIVKALKQKALKAMKTMKKAMKAKKAMKGMKTVKGDEGNEGWIEVCHVTGIRWQYDADDWGIDRGFMDDFPANSDSGTE